MKRTDKIEQENGFIWNNVVNLRIVIRLSGCIHENNKT